VLVLFDIDGTLLSGADAHLQAMAEAVQMVVGHLPPVCSDDEVGAYVGEIRINGLVDPQILALMLDAVGTTDDPATVRRIAGLAGPRYRDLLQRGAPPATALPGAVALVEALAGAGAKVGVATGNLRSIGVTKLAAAGFAGLFHCGAFSDAHRDRTAVVAEGCAHARPGEGVWVVGDTPADVAAGRANGVQVLAVTTGAYGPEELTGADVVADSLADVGALRAILSSR
jgi:phosphoglycolate phosphatase